MDVPFPNLACVPGALLPSWFKDKGIHEKPCMYHATSKPRTINKGLTSNCLLVLAVQARTYLQPHYGNVFWQCLPFSWTTLRDKHCRHLIAIMGVEDTFGLSQLFLECFLLVNNEIILNAY